jgi:hypothetical protein
MFFIPLCAAGVLFGGAAWTVRSEELQADWDRWLQRLKAGRQGVPVQPEGAEAPVTAPLRVAQPGGRPLWMEDTTPAEEVDPRIASALVFDPALDSPGKSKNHWTLRGAADEDQSRGDGGA